MKENKQQAGTNMHRCLACLIRGRVQGVYFRSETRARARELGIYGWVRNRADGQVEAMICGTAEQLETMTQWLAHGPSGARVDDLECTACPPPTEPVPGQFHIRY